MQSCTFVWQRTFDFSNTGGNTWSAIKYKKNKAYGTVQLSEVIVAGTKQNATKQNDNISNEKNE